ncbi:SbcC/MukB-like Walker B domain-containing protein [Sulfurimonas sp. CS5]|uniref:SbcC/MukB-like Walker B domain-containing protein n=1 Tax=Sulfurimonas sp. CS5 TaxID=3391145 RepID=UPI0039ED6CF5
MKIISIKSLNINSLKGITEINFAELTKDSALFSITGPTGSGKSTILDIISCALYGRTARLKNPNDLMSRHSGEAYCEVEFEIRGKTYRSSWTQKRAHKKYDGVFQTAKMELIDLEEDKILPLKSREVPKKIEELSGLDFGRFTQSMLLAQGGFDAFLKADEKERSALLEKITGTQIYADISIAIFEKHRGFQQEMDSDKKILESIELLDKTVVEEKQKQLNENIAKKRETDEELKKLTLSLSWLQRLSELTKDSRRYEEEFKEVAKLKEESKNSFLKLALANRALNVFATFSSHAQLQKSVSVDKITAMKLTGELTLLDEEIKNKDKEHSVIKKEFEKDSAEFEAQNQKLKEAREIQTQEKEAKINLSKEEKLLKGKQENLMQITNSLNSIVKDHNDIQKEVDTKKSYLLTNAKDEKLLSVIGMIEQNIREYKKERESLTNNQGKLEASESTFLSQDTNYNLKKEEVDKLSSIFKEKELVYIQLEQNSLNDFKIEEGSKKSLEDTQTLTRALESYTKVAKNKDKELEEHQKNSDLVNSLMETKSVSQQYIDEIKKHIETLREKQEKEQLLKKYEEDRNNLVDGEACLLCGSTEHPYVNGLNEVHIDKTKQMIASQVKELEDKEKALKELELRLGIAQTKKETSILEIQKLDKEIETLKNLFKQYSFEPTSDSEIELKEKEEVLTKKLDVVKQNRIQKDELLKQRDSAGKQLQVQEKLLDQIKSVLEKLSTEKEQLILAVKSNEAKIKEYLKSMELDLEKFDLKLDLEKLDIQYKELVSRKELYIETSEALKVLDIELNKCSVIKKESETRATLLAKEIELIEANIKELVLNLAKLSSKRIEILNVADLDVHEKEITTKYKMAQERKQLCTTALNELKIKSEERLANKKSLDIEIAEDEKKLDALKAELEELYKQNDFKDAQELQNAMLDKNEREELSTLCKTIEDRYKQTQTLKAETINKLQEHNKEPLSDKPIEELEVLQALLGQKADALAESIGSDKKELELNQENSDKHKERILSLEKKKESFKVWVKLNELVGSADGTKFKKFAQGITLDQLINLANQHLNILSSRYTLARSQDKLLELEIIDAYQGNVVRPVSTLSGGESFIVSLALALGLSELASQKIAIDSLFLDEGFGTLDEDSLETALNALNLLQSGGKMVGVISHVEALKERIPLQIKVIPNGDGTSFIEI